MNRRRACAGFVLLVVQLWPAITMLSAEDCRLQLRTVGSNPDGSIGHQLSQPVVWKLEETAVIVCDVWDYHHSINAVGRLEEMLPRMNALLQAARRQGALIIHAPSDCMPAYESHAARIRAIETPVTKLPTDIASWCSRIAAEETGKSSYPIDQSDGGEDDDPQEHLQWAAKLQGLGRNPNMPWKAQSPAITIDAGRDYISDRGDEVWNVLQHRQIRHVMMLGVHTNMCVLGRPFGLRQMVQQKMDTVLVRDMTDCMYNPKSWPYTDHFTGNELVISYVERFVCPTITSDQILGGQPFRFRGDHRPARDVISVIAAKPKEWMVQNLDGLRVASSTGKVAGEDRKSEQHLIWIRCSLRFPAGSLDHPAILIAAAPVKAAWLNGQSLDVKSTNEERTEFQIVKDVTMGNDDANLLVLHFDFSHDVPAMIPPPKLQSSLGTKELNGKWELKHGASESAHNIPLPAKFGMSPEVFYTLP